MSVTEFSASPIPERRCGIRRQRGPKKLVGVICPHYGLERVSYALPVEGYEFGTVRRLPWQWLDRSGDTFWSSTPIVLDRSAHLFHTFNLLPLNGLFVVSFEYELPRYFNDPRPWQIRLGMRLLDGPRCKAILALTELAAGFVRRELEKAGLPEATRKVSVFRGGVMPGLPKDLRPRNGPLRLLFVGADGFRKGIVPVLDALEQLCRGGVELEFTVISSLTIPTNYTHREQTPVAAPFRERLRSLPWVKYHDSLPNTQVRRLMREHDLLLLPSFDEAAAWTPVEAGMEGLAAIVTSISSFPEVVSDDVTGMKIRIPADAENRWAGLHVNSSSRAERIEETNRIITAGLIEVLQRVAADRSIAQRWGVAAQAKMMQMFHPAAAASQLKLIYDSALSL
jgi:glycosyltransferase involved in cell wall biosynthesis